MAKEADTSATLSLGATVVVDEEEEEAAMVVEEEVVDIVGASMVDTVFSTGIVISASSCAPRIVATESERMRTVEADPSPAAGPDAFVASFVASFASRGLLSATPSVVPAVSVTDGIPTAEGASLTRRYVLIGAFPEYDM